MGILPVETDMETFGKEGDTCGVRINAVEADGGITGWVFVKIPPAVAVVVAASITPVSTA